MPGSPDRTSFIPGRVNVSPSDTQGGSRVPELGPLGSVRGALSNGSPYRDSHAVLGVFDEGPLAASSPFWAHPNVTVLPHISAPTDHESAAQVVADNVGRFRRGEHIPGVVDISRGY